MKKIIITLFIVLLLTVLSLFVVYVYQGVFDSSQIVIKEINLDQVDDGTHYGSCVTKLVKVSVIVYVFDSNIYKIELLEHDHMLGKKAETIIDEAMDNNSLLVDTISGATYSSKVILKAIENAVISGTTNYIDLSDYKLVELVGTIDGNSFEAIYDDFAIAFRYNEIESKLAELSIDEGDMIYIKFTKNNIGQNIVIDIIKK